MCRLVSVGDQYCFEKVDLVCILLSIAYQDAIGKYPHLEDTKMKSACIILILGFALLAALATAEPPIPQNYAIGTPYLDLQNEEQIWTCPTDSNIHIAVWRDFRLGYRQIGIGRSWFDNSFWIDSLIHPDMQMFMQQSDPCLTVDNDGNFYICVLDYQPSATSIYDSSYLSVLKSTDKGVSWTGPVTVEDTLGPYFEDKQFTVVDRTDGPHSGNYYVAWARFPNPNRIMFVRSTDGAQTFDDTLIVGPNIDATPCGWGILDAGQFACPAVGSDGAVYVMWIGGDLDTTTCDYFTSMKMVKSIDGGQSFTEPVVIRHTAGNWGEVDGGVDVYNQPVVATDVWGGGHDGNIYVAYASVDIDNPLYDYNIEFIRSLDGGASWSDKTYINDDFVGSGAVFDQFHPWLICNEEGVLVCLWYDQRTDPTNHYLFDAFVAYSFDGGETFTTNHRISGVSIDPGSLKLSKRTILTPDDPRMEITSGRSPRAGLIAEYIGVTAFNDHINATWTDTRAGNQDVYGANWTIPLMKPRLVSPADGAVTPDPTPTFHWATAWHEDDDQYILQVASGSDFTTTTFFECIGIDNQCTYSGDPLEEDSTYYWRVKVIKLSTGEFSEYSEGRSFALGTPSCFATGDVNDDGIPLTNADFNYLVDYVEGVGPAPPVLYSGDMNGDCEIDHLDVALYQDYFTDGLGVFTNGFPVPTCCEVNTTRGACCVLNTCFTLSPGNCFLYDGGIYKGDGTSCIDDPCSCCIGIRGNVDGDPDDIVDISDLVYLVDYMFSDGPAPPCPNEADIDPNEAVDISDLVYLVDYMFSGGPPPADCP
jgi:hypothetical protein